MSVTYYTASGQAAFNTAATIGLPVWDQPFPELTDRILFRQRFMQTAASYQPITPNTTYPAHGQYGVPTSSSYYLVAEENFKDERAGLLTWDRVYAAVPPTRYEYTTLAYNYPAIVTTFYGGSLTYVTVTYAQAAGADRMFLTTSLSANPGDLLSLSYNTGFISGALAQVLVRDYASGGLIVDINTAFISSTYSKAAARVYRSVPSSRPISDDMVGRAVIEYSYVLVTPNVTPNFTFTVRQHFLLDGQDVDYVSTQTIPSASVYLGWVASGSFFRAEDDSWGRWLGNIYEKRVVQVVAL